MEDNKVHVMSAEDYYYSLLNKGEEVVMCNGVLNLNCRGCNFTMECLSHNSSALDLTEREREILREEAPAIIEFRVNGRCEN